jgi:chorismate mutase
MTKPPPTDAPSLGDLRKEIDRIDETMHRLLMERGEIIDRLIKVKQKTEDRLGLPPGARGRHDAPLVERHHGILPLDTVESIWRVIIATFTHVQAPFSVHADLSAGDAMMRDSARFHFGFTVPFVPHMGAASVVAAVSSSKGDLGLVPASPPAAAPGGARSNSPAPRRSSPGCRSSTAPTIRPAAVFVVSRAAADAMVTEVEVWSVRVSGWGAAAARAIAPLAEVIAVPDGAFDGAALLVSVPPGDLADITGALVKAGASVRSTALVGSHATRYTVPAGKGA